MRIFWGIISGLVGVILLMGIIDSIVTREQRHALSWVVDGWLTLNFLLSAVCCFRSSRWWLSRLKCTRCQSHVLEPSVVTINRVGPLAILLGGAVFMIAWGLARGRNVVCATCQQNQIRSTFGTWLARSWVLGSITALIDNLVNP